MARGTSSTPGLGKKKFEAYAEEWLEGRRLGLMTRDTYADTLTRHVYPTFGHLPSTGSRLSSFGSWNRPSPTGFPSTAAKAYRILKAILATAVEDQIIPRNPCASEAPARTQSATASSYQPTSCSRSPTLRIRSAGNR
jgi:hypothetical protein